MISDVSVFRIATMKTLFFMHLDPICKPGNLNFKNLYLYRLKCFAEFCHGVYFVKSQPL